MTAIAGVAAEAVCVDLGSLRVQLTRARNLAAHLDPLAQLRDADAPEPPYWMHVWPGAVALARRVATESAIGPGARVLELGCGLALPALTAARRGAAVVVTDWKRAPLAFVAASAARNACRLSRLQMDWRRPAVRGVFDVCLAADVAYDRDGHAALAGAVATSLAPDGVAWFADSVHATCTRLAEALRTRGLRVQMTNVQELEEGRPVWVRLLDARWR